MYSFFLNFSFFDIKLVFYIHSGHDIVNISNNIEKDVLLKSAKHIYSAFPTQFSFHEYIEYQ